MAIEPSPELESISHRLAAEKGLEDSARLELVQAYLDFLHGAAASRKDVLPTHAVDEIWHRHILDTQSYARDCARWFGRFIHHQPDTLPDEAAGPGGALADCSAPNPDPPCRAVAAAVR